MSLDALNRISQRILFFLVVFLFSSDHSFLCNNKLWSLFTSYRLFFHHDVRLWSWAAFDFGELIGAQFYPLNRRLIDNYFSCCRNRVVWFDDTCGLNYANSRRFEWAQKVAATRFGFIYITRLDFVDYLSWFIDYARKWPSSHFLSAYFGRCCWYYFHVTFYIRDFYKTRFNNVIQIYVLLKPPIWRILRLDLKQNETYDYQRIT